MKAALEAFGASAEIIKNAVANQPMTEFGLWAENETTMDVLIAMRTQLRRSGMSGRVCGLDYAVLPWVMTRVGVLEPETDDVFFRLQQAESELVTLLSQS